MCQTCVDDGTIAEWLFEIVLAHESVYDDGYGPAHIVIADCNLRDSHIRWCLDEWAPSDRGPWRGFLNWLLTIPETERVPKLTAEV